MTLKDIKTAVNTALKTAYPGYKIYGNDTVEGYERPSFFVYVTQTFSESTVYAVHKNVNVEIDFIQKKSDEGEGMDFFSAMETLFRQKLVVCDRYLNTSEHYTRFEGEHSNIPVYEFDVEFWDAIPRRDNDIAFLEHVEIDRR